MSEKGIEVIGVQALREALDRIRFGFYEDGRVWLYLDGRVDLEGTMGEAMQVHPTAEGLRTIRAWNAARDAALSSSPPVGVSAEPPASDSPAGLTDEQLLLALWSLNPDKQQERALTFTSWKDGIDIDVPNEFFRRLGAALAEQASPSLSSVDSTEAKANAVQRPAGGDADAWPATDLGATDEQAAAIRRAAMNDAADAQARALGVKPDRRTDE